MSDSKPRKPGQASKRGVVKIVHATLAEGPQRLFDIVEDELDNIIGDEEHGDDGDHAIEATLEAELDLVDHEALQADVRVGADDADEGAGEAQDERAVDAARGPVRSMIVNGEAVRYQLSQNGDVFHVSSLQALGRLTGPFGKASKQFHQLSWSEVCRQCGGACRIVKSNRQFMSLGGDEDLLIRWLLLPVTSAHRDLERTGDAHKDLWASISS